MPLSMLIYNLAVGVGLFLGWPLLAVWAVCVPKVRAGFWQKLGCYSTELKTAVNKGVSHAKANQQPVVWLHAVSVGEFNALRPLIAQLQAENAHVVVTTTTLTGQRLANQALPAGQVLYCPYDVPLACQAAVTLIQPDVLVIAETELWPNLIAIVARRCPVVVVNGRLSERSFKGYRRWLGWLLPTVLGKVYAVLAQTQADAEHYAALGAKTVDVTGNLKLDIPKTINPSLQAQLREAFALPKSPSADLPVIVLASTHPGEEVLFLSVVQRLLVQYPKGRWLVAPRHPERAEAVAQELATALNQPIALRSQAVPGHPVQTPVAVLDTVGELSTLYSLASAVIIGGSFLPKRGGQNPLEALAAGVPVIHGPHMRNFRHIVALLVAYRAAIQVNTVTDAEAALHQLLTQSDTAQRQTQAGFQLLAEHGGATVKTADFVQNLLKQRV